MAERRRKTHVAASELVRPASNLESLVVDMSQGKFLSYGNFPPQILASRIETYANEMSESTSKDNRERAAILSIQRGTNMIILPDPSVGTEGEVDVPVPPQMARSEEFIPSLDIHSHVSDSPPSSGGDSDMGVLLAGVSGYVPLAMLVSSPEHNYLIIKSQQTMTRARPTSANIERFRERRQIFPEIYKNFVNRLRAGTGGHMYGKVEQQILYYDNMIEVLNICEGYQLGFYRSEKDGTYIRITPAMIEQQMEASLEKLLQMIEDKKKSLEK